MIRLIRFSKIDLHKILLAETNKNYRLKPSRNSSQFFIRKFGDEWIYEEYVLPQNHIDYLKREGVVEETISGKLKINTTKIQKWKISP